MADGKYKAAGAWPWTSCRRVYRSCLNAAPIGEHPPFRRVWVSIYFLADCQMWEAVWHFPRQVLGAPEHSSVVFCPSPRLSLFRYCSTVLRVSFWGAFPGGWLPYCDSLSATLHSEKEKKFENVEKILQFCGIFQYFKFFLNFEKGF